MTKTAMGSLSASLALAVTSIGIAGCQSMSDRQHHTAVGAGVGGAVAAVAGNLWSKHMEEKRAEMNRAAQGTDIQVARTSDNQPKVHVPSDFSFDSGSAMIKPQMRPVLDQFAQGWARISAPENLEPADRASAWPPALLAPQALPERSTGVGPGR